MDSEIENNVGTYLGKRLQEIGIKEYFIVPGDYNLVLLDQLLKIPGLKMVGCCNELNASYAADGYARSKGLACCVVTFTVGGLSAINGIAGAYSDDLPVILISGGPNSNDFASDRVLHHTTGRVEHRQQLEMYSHVVACTVEVRSPSRAARLIDQAIVVALTENKPVYIEIACNLAEEPIPGPIPLQMPPDKPSNSVALRRALDATLKLWNIAQKPVIVIGVKIRRAQAHSAVIKLAKAAGCAVAVMPDAKGMFPEDQPGFIGTYWGPVSSAGCGETIESADLYLFVGARFNDYNTTGYSCLIKHKSLVKVSTNRVETPSGEYGCVHLPEFCEALAQEVTSKDASLRVHRRIFVEEARLEDAGADALLTMRYVKNAIQGMLTSQTALVAETGDSWFQGQKLKLPPGCDYEFQMQYGSIGWSVGAVLGYSLAQREKHKRVIAMIGDGSFQMSAQEVSTMIRHGADPIIFLINNQGYAIEVEIHDGPYNRIQNWDYTAFVEAMHNGQGMLYTARCDRQGQLDDAIRKAHDFSGLAFIELMVDSSDISKELLEWGSRVGATNSRRYVEV